MKEIQTQLDVISAGAILDKKALIKGAKNLASKIISDGEVDPLKLQVRMKRAATFLGELEKALENAVLQEAEQYSEKEFEVDGAKVQVREVGVKYSYDLDERWKYLKKLEDEMAQNRKDHENFLRSLKEAMQVVDDETGEVCHYKPVAKTSKTKAVITIK